MKNIIGISGHAGAGKDTFASVLVERYGFVRMAFADKLKEIISDAYDVPVEFFNDRVLKNEVHPNLCGEYITRKFTSSELVNWYAGIHRELDPKQSILPPDTVASAIFHNLLPHNSPVSPRKAAQIIGTEGFRTCVSPSVWIDYLISKARTYGRVVVTDVRFKDEAEAIKQSGGIMIGIYRDKIERYDHVSEVGIAEIIESANIIIDNNGTLEELKEKAIDFGNSLGLPVTPATGSSRKRCLHRD